MQNTPDFDKMQRLSADIRIETLHALSKAGSGHVGGAASMADVLAVLYGGVMNIDPQNPRWEGRDWLVLSKGHTGPSLYAALAIKGFFPKEWLMTINQPKTNLPSHADRQKTPGIDMTTGSLGQGISAASGIALGNRLQGRDSWTYCIVGDGECNEGQVWECLQAANHNKLDHFIVFVDWNKKQLDGTLEEINEPVNLANKFSAFGFDTQQVNGNDVKAVYEAIEKAKATPGKPHAIVLDTVKGMGFPFAEKLAYNHHIPVSKEDAEAAIAEIEKRLADGTYPGGGAQ